MQLNVDVLIFGGGGAGLWLLDELHRRRHSVLLLESASLGTDQTAASQGIIHGGIKYTLAGALTESAEALREMPALWRECLEGNRQPDLRDTQVLTDHCHLWRTAALKSRLGLVGARTGLRSTTNRVAAADRPAELAACPGNVFRVDEQVIDSVGCLRSIARRHAPRLGKFDFPKGADFQLSGAGRVHAVHLTHPGGHDPMEVRPARVVLTAGAGNAALRERLGLSTDLMQRRPLRMVMVRGKLPLLFGHCVDGAKTRVTITSATDPAGRVVWQVGGQVAEDGVKMDETELIRHARAELRQVIPGIDLSALEWSTYAVDRVEGKTSTGARPAGPQVYADGNVITAWPTKLALVPQLAKLIADRLGPPSDPTQPGAALPADWPRPAVALPPWEQDRSWHLLD